MEVFSGDGRNYLLAFQKGIRNKVYQRYRLLRILHNAVLWEAMGGVKHYKFSSFFKNQLNTWINFFEENVSFLPASWNVLLLMLFYFERTFFFLLVTYSAAAAKSLQSCPTLCDPRDGSPPGSPVPGVLQARTLEWVVISFSKLTLDFIKISLSIKEWWNYSLKNNTLGSE